MTCLWWDARAGSTGGRDVEPVPNLLRRSGGGGLQPQQVLRSSRLGGAEPIRATSQDYYPVTRRAIGSEHIPASGASQCVNNYRCTVYEP
jgi:hypothetical protein